MLISFRAKMINHFGEADILMVCLSSFCTRHGRIVRHPSAGKNRTATMRYLF